MRRCPAFLKGYRSIVLLVLLNSNLSAQPYVDLLQVRYTHAFKNSKTAATAFTHLWAGTDLPLKVKNNTYILLSPYYETWKFDFSDNQEAIPRVQSITFAAGLLFPLKNPSWTATILPIVRWNSEQLFSTNSAQVGLVAFTSYARRPKQKFRFGLYVNKEFFGLFVVPLVGTDWRIDSRNYLYGLLPGKLTFEHQLNRQFYWGATFRAITNSYRLANTQFVRLDDNQLSLYLDYYPVKKLCITVEPGFGLLRKMRTGINSKSYISSIDWGDGPFIKLSASYRIRL